MAPTRRSRQPDGSLAEGAAAAVACLGVAADDEVLVLCNEAQREMAKAIARAAQPAAMVRMFEYPTASRHGEEPPSDVADALASATAIFALTTYSVSHTRVRHDATLRGARIATMAGITEEVFRRALSVDYTALKRTSEAMADELTTAVDCRVLSERGTDLTLSLEGREGISDDGNLQGFAAWGNLPAGEAFIAPIETQGDGTIVFDGALAGYGMLTEPLRVSVVDGYAVDAEGEAWDWLLSTLDAGGPNGRRIAEVGIGTNPEAMIGGDICEDEKVAGTVHLAFGTSASIGGATVAQVHLDGVLLAPTVELDGRTLMSNGNAELAH